MAIKIWTGGTSTSFNAAANWTGGVPVDADEVHYTEDVSGAGKFACTSDMDQNAKNFTKVVVGGEYVADVGTDADPLRCGCDELHMNGRGAMYFRADDGSLGSDWLDKVFMRSGTLWLEATPVAAQTVSYVLCTGGILNLRNGGTITTMVVRDIARNVARPTVNASTSWTDILTLHLSGAMTFSAGNLNVCDVYNGQLLLTDTGQVQSRLTIHDRGSVDWRSSGTLTLVECRGGRLTGRRNIKPTPTIETLQGWAGTADLRTGRGNIVVTNPILVDGPDFVVHCDPNKQLTYANQ